MTSTGQDKPEERNKAALQPGRTGIVRPPLLTTTSNFIALYALPESLALEPSLCRLAPYHASRGATRGRYTSGDSLPIFEIKVPLKQSRIRDSYGHQNGLRPRSERG